MSLIVLFSLLWRTSGTSTSERFVLNNLSILKEVLTLLWPPRRRMLSSDLVLDPLVNQTPLVFDKRENILQLLHPLLMICWSSNPTSRTSPPSSNSSEECEEKEDLSLPHQTLFSSLIFVSHDTSTSVLSLPSLSS
jgi:hypothetical protein